MMAGPPNVAGPGKAFLLFWWAYSQPSWQHHRKTIEVNWCMFICGLVVRSSELVSASSMKRHKSLEDLQTVGIREEEEDGSNTTSQSVAYDRKSPGRSSRGCGVNESFRAAIDRSYEPDGTKTIEATGNMLGYCVIYCTWTICVISVVLF